MQEIGIGTDIKESDTEDTSKSETTTAPSFSRPATIPTIIQTDDFKRSEVRDVFEDLAAVLYSYALFQFLL